MKILLSSVVSVLQLKFGESEEVVTVTKADVKDALVEAGYIPGEYDQISANGDTVASSDTIQLVSVSIQTKPKRK